MNNVKPLFQDARDFAGDLKANFLALVRDTIAFGVGKPLSKIARHVERAADSAEEIEKEMIIVVSTTLGRIVENTAATAQCLLSIDATLKKLVEVALTAEQRETDLLKVAMSLETMLKDVQLKIELSADPKFGIPHLITMIAEQLNAAHGGMSIR